jgi:hypothetical protein
MKRYLLAALAVVALLTATMSAPALGAKSSNRGNKSEVKVCRTQFDDLGFKNRGACGRVFTQAPDGFAEACASLGGFVEESAFANVLANPRASGSLAPACAWANVSFDAAVRLWDAAPWSTLCHIAWGGWARNAVLIGCDGLKQLPPSEPDKDFAGICSSNNGTWVETHSNEDQVYMAPWIFTAACVWDHEYVSPRGGIEEFAAYLQRHCSKGMRWLRAGDSDIAGCPAVAFLNPADPVGG